jgi:hypothetical protein
MNVVVGLPLIVALRPSRLRGADTTTSSVYVPLQTTTVAHFGAAVTADWIVAYRAVLHDSPELVEAPSGETKIASLSCVLALAEVTPRLSTRPAAATNPAVKMTRIVLAACILPPLR